MTYDASDPRNVREAEKSSRLAEVQRHDAVRGIMSVAGGRRWLWELLSDCGVFREDCPENPYLAYFNKGIRNVGLRIYADAMQFPDLHATMVREANDRDAAHDARRRRRSDDAQRVLTDHGGDDPDNGVERDDSGDTAD